MTKLHLNNIKKEGCFERLSLVVEKGTMVAISGANYDCLIRIIAGYEQVDSGTYQLEYHRNETKDLDALAAMRQEKIGFVPKEVQLLPHLTATENIEMPFFFQTGANRMNAAKHQRLEQFSRLFGLQDIMKKKARELTYGEQKCLTILRALLNMPSILVLDDPIAQTDDETTMQIMNFLRAKKVEGISVIIGTNDEGIIAQCDKEFKVPALES